MEYICGIPETSTINQCPLGEQFIDGLLRRNVSNHTILQKLGVYGWEVGILTFSHIFNAYNIPYPLYPSVYPGIYSETSLIRTHLLWMKWQIK